VELALRFETTSELDLESAFAAGADGFSKSSGPELDMDEASFAPKAEGAADGDTDASRGGAGAVGAATGMRVASTCIGVPRVRLHSMRQRREI
jgi:hypothetical protein